MNIGKDMVKIMISENLKMYRVIGKEYNCVYVSALSNKSIGNIIRETEERTGKIIDRLEHVKTFPAN